MPKENDKGNTEVDTAIFDDTLKEIEESLQYLGQKIETKQNPLKIREIEEGVSEKTEHEIDSSLLTIEELQNYNANIIKRKKNSFYFYIYLFLIIVIFYSLYTLLNFSKDLIISKYPITEPAISYFYEIIDIFKSIIYVVSASIENIF